MDGKARWIIGLVTALVWAGPAAAKPKGAGTPDPRVAAIKAAYAEVDGAIADQTFRDAPVVLNSVVPGIGDHRKDLHFYATAAGQLRKVTVQYAVAASGLRYREFVFDGEGRMVFHYAWSEQARDCGGYTHTLRDETRAYFADGQLIDYRARRRIVETDPGDATTEGCAPLLYETVRGPGTFQPAEAKAAKAMLADGARYREIHAQLDQHPRKRIQKRVEAIEGI